MIYSFVLMFVLNQLHCNAESVSEDARSMQIKEEGFPTKDFRDFSTLIVRRWADRYSSVSFGNDQYRRDIPNDNPLILLQRTKYQNPKWVQMLCNLAESGLRSKSNYKESVWNKIFILDFLRNHQSYLKPGDLKRSKMQKKNRFTFSDAPNGVDPTIYRDVKNAKELKNKVNAKNDNVVIKVDLLKPPLKQEQHIRISDYATENPYLGLVQNMDKLSRRLNTHKSANGLKISVPTSPLFPQTFAFSHNNSVTRNTKTLRDTYQKMYDNLVELKTQLPLQMKRRIEGLKYFNRVCALKNCYGGWESEFSNNIFKVPQTRYNRNVKSSEDDEVEYDGSALVNNSDEDNVQ